MSLLKTLQRQWNVLNLQPDEQIAPARAAVLAAVSDAGFIVTITEFKQSADVQGGDLYIAAIRRKYDAEGAEIPKADERDTVGNYVTIGFEVVAKSAGEAETLELPCYEPLEQVEMARSQAEALALSEIADAEFIKSCTDLRIILERFGGQVRIFAARNADQTTGYVFGYERRDAPLLVSAYPVLEADEQQEASKTAETEEPPEPEKGQEEGDSLRDEIEAEVDALPTDSEAEEEPVAASG